MSSLPPLNSFLPITYEHGNDLNPEQKLSKAITESEVFHNISKFDAMELLRETPMGENKNYYLVIPDPDSKFDHSFILLFTPPHNNVAVLPMEHETILGLFFQTMEKMAKKEKYVGKTLTFSCFNESLKTTRSQLLKSYGVPSDNLTHELRVKRCVDRSFELCVIPRRLDKKGEENNYFLGKGTFKRVYLAHHLKAYQKTHEIFYSKKALSFIKGRYHRKTQNELNAYENALNQTDNCKANLLPRPEKIIPFPYSDVTSDIEIVQECANDNFEDVSLTFTIRYSPELQLGSMDLINILKDVTEQLTAIHKNGYVHRDVKPLNIVTLPPFAKKRRLVDGTLIDFGGFCPFGKKHIQNPGLEAKEYFYWDSVGRLFGTATYFCDAFGIAVSAFNFLTSDLNLDFFLENMNPIIRNEEELKAAQEKNDSFLSKCQYKVLNKILTIIKENLPSFYNTLPALKSKNGSSYTDYFTNLQTALLYWAKTSPNEDKTLLKDILAEVQLRHSLCYLVLEIFNADFERVKALYEQQISTPTCIIPNSTLEKLEDISASVSLSNIYLRLKTLYKEYKK